jgi:hypothetical protein
VVYKKICKENKIKYMKRVIKFNEMFNNKTLIYYSFDIDDNLLYMPTRIHMDHLVNGNWVTTPVDTEKFAVIRSDKENWRFKPGRDGDESFEEFRDWGPNGDDTFLLGFKYAVKHGKFGPSWTRFIECLINGYIFSIVTSRGHSPLNVRRAIEWLIYEYGLDNFRDLPMKNVDKREPLEDQMIQNLLSYHELFGSEPDYVVDQYLESCPIYTISSPYFKEHFGKLPAEEAKRVGD